MHACTVIAYHVDGAVVCPDCIGPDADAEETGVVFADNLSDEVGATCDTCGACLDNCGAWIGNDILNRQLYKWSCCAACNDQRPWRINSFEYRATRLAALRGELECRQCRKSDVHF